MVEITVDNFGDVIVVNINGIFSIESTEYADSVWQEQIGKKPKTIGFNCNKISSIDSSALGYLVSRLNEAMKMGVDVVFYDLSDETKRVFKTAKLLNFFKIMEKWKFEMQYLP